MKAKSPHEGMREVKPIRGEQLMTPNEVAKKLRISVKTVYLMAAQNEIPPHKIRSSLRFDSADIDDYIFFSKYRQDNSHYLRPSDIEELWQRVNASIEQAKYYIEKLLVNKQTGGGHEKIA